MSKKYIQAIGIGAVVLLLIGFLIIGEIRENKEREEEAQWQRFSTEHKCTLVKSQTDRNSDHVGDLYFNHTYQTWKCDDGKSYDRSFTSQ